MSFFFPPLLFCLFCFSLSKGRRASRGLHGLSARVSQTSFLLLIAFLPTTTKLTLFHKTNPGVTQSTPSFSSQPYAPHLPSNHGYFPGPLSLGSDCSGGHPFSPLQPIGGLSPFKHPHLVSGLFKVGMWGGGRGPRTSELCGSHPCARPT